MAARPYRLNGRGPVTRRSMLGGIAGGGAAAAAALVVGCGDDSTSNPTKAPSATGASPAALPTGGTVHFAGSVAIPSLDPYTNISQTGQVPATICTTGSIALRAVPTLSSGST